MNISCKICENSYSSYRRLCKHVRDVHGLTSQIYYDQCVKRNNEGTCHYCGNQTKFQSIALGYRVSCRSCKSQKAKDYRLAQKQDIDKHTAFVSKVKQNQRRIWANRKTTGEDTVIRNKIGQTIKSNNLKLTDQELSDNYGWFNKLTLEEKNKWVQEVMLLTGAPKWWKQASQEEIKQVVVKRMSTIASVSEELIQHAIDRPNDYTAYTDAVWYVTHNSYARYKHLLDPDGKRGPDWHLDHIYSVKMGFVNNISPEIIGSRHNLRIISKTQNLQKHMRCDITLEKLLEKFHE